MQKLKHPWFRKRGYLHFDNPVSNKHAKKIVSNPVEVARHSFYPLIDYQIKTYKIYKDEADDQIKKKTKIRPIAYASHVDSLIYGFYAYNLGKKYEKTLKICGLESAVLAFRSLKKCNIDFANDAFENIKKRGICSAIAFDVKKFFDSLDHQLLKDAWLKILDVCTLPKDHFNIYKSLTKFSKVKKDDVLKVFNIAKTNQKRKRSKICKPSEFRKNIRSDNYITTNSHSFGIPQGTPISAFLSNIYMLEFDKIVNDKMKDIDGSYYRYCDDILIILPTIHKEDIKQFVKDQINKLKLELNENKTEIVDYYLNGGQQRCSPRPLQYLGFTFDGQRKLIRSAALARYSNRMKSGVRLAKNTRDKYNNIRIERGDAPKPLYKKKIYQRYSHLGKRNFIRYALRASIIMKSQAIKKQLRPLWSRLQSEIIK